MERNCSTLLPAQQRNRNSEETYITKYKNLRKWMVEFLRKLENRGIKIVRVNSILITISINLVIYFNFVRCWGSVVMLTSLNKPPVRFINREVNGLLFVNPHRIKISFSHCLEKTKSYMLAYIYWQKIILGACNLQKDENNIYIKHVQETCFIT